MYRMKTVDEFIADGWTQKPNGELWPPDGTGIRGACVTTDMLSFQTNQDQDDKIARASHFSAGNYTYDPRMFTRDTGKRAVSKPFENIEEGGCICFMKKHRFSGHMRYCPAYS